MSKERLAKMNKKVVGLTDGEDFSDLVQMDVDTYAWFYKQAERAQELEEDNESLQILSRINRKESMRLHEQNKCYREAIGEIRELLRGRTDSILQDEVDEIIKALESD